MEERKMPEPIRRKDAIAKGLKRYFTGKPCLHGHICERFITRGCVECGHKNRAKWFENNREKERVYRREFYRKNPDKQREKMRDQYRANPDPKRKWARDNYPKTKERDRRKQDLFAVLKKEMPELLKEFGL